MKIDYQIIAIIVAVVVLFPIWIWQRWVDFKNWRDIGKKPDTTKEKPRH